MDKYKSRMFIISDLHLSFSVDKPMDIFGGLWENHVEKLKNNWCNAVCNDDWVIIPGDISWAMTMEEALLDLKFLNDLPGKKILMKGNHDYWWSSLSKLNQYKKDNQLDTLFFVYNESFYIEECDAVVIGTRGWHCVGDKDFTEEDLKIYKREILRFGISVKDSEKHMDARKICVFHYPPFNGNFESSGFTVLMKSCGISECFYGHIHGIYGGIYDRYTDIPVSANPDGVDCRLISADYIGFSPVIIN